jgi:hypothetical protein
VDKSLSLSNVNCRLCRNSCICVQKKAIAEQLGRQTISEPPLSIIRSRPAAARKGSVSKKRKVGLGIVCQFGRVRSSRTKKTKYKLKKNVLSRGPLKSVLLYIELRWSAARMCRYHPLLMQDIRTNEARTVQRFSARLEI